MQNFIELFKQSFIADHRYRYYLRGLGNTLLVTLGALLIGVLIGFIVAAIRSTHDKADHPGIVLRILNVLAKVYLTVIRGTPMVIQLMISFYIIFTAPNASGTLVAILSFGINSGAYVAEVVRSGIMSIDVGQTEAGRSLGLSYMQTMRYIILPQAFKNVLPALGNELITLLKETSVLGYVGMVDLTKAGDIVRSTTFQPFFPLISVAVIYLIMVMGLTALVGMMERRLRTSER